NRVSDCDYFRDCGLRKEMFEQLVVTPLKGHFPAIAVNEDAYWGDLGVRYLWGLRSVPPTQVLQSLGKLGPDEPVDERDNPDLLILLDKVCPSRALGGGLGTLGPSPEPGPLAAVARRAPADLIRAISAPEWVGPEAAVIGGEPELDASD